MTLVFLCGKTRISKHIKFLVTSNFIPLHFRRSPWQYLNVVHVIKLFWSIAVDEGHLKLG